MEELKIVVKCLHCESPDVFLKAKIDVEFQFDDKGGVVLDTDVADAIYWGVEYRGVQALCVCPNCGTEFTYDEWKKSLKQNKKGGLVMNNIKNLVNSTFSADFKKDNMKLGCSPCGALKIAKEACDKLDCKKCKAWWQEEYKGSDEMFRFNRDTITRDEIIFGKYEPNRYAGGIRRFDGLSLEKLKQLAELNFIDLESYHNSSPTVR